MNESQIRRKSRYIKPEFKARIDAQALSEDGNFGIEIWKASQNAILPISKNLAKKVTVILEGSA
ncbi:MAG: hypothetical protein QW674_03275 [Candidatus Bathyarchaeia archaeon]